MTSLPSFLSDMPAPASSLFAMAFASGSAAPAALAGGGAGAGSDFAGMLDAASAAPPAAGDAPLAGTGSGTGATGTLAAAALPLPGALSPLAASTGASLMAESLPPPAVLPVPPVPVPASQPAIAPMAPLARAGGNFLPETGAQLPPALPLETAVPGAGVPMPPLTGRDVPDEAQDLAPGPLAPEAPSPAVVPPAHRPDDAEALAEVPAAPPIVPFGLPVAAAAVPAEALPALANAAPARGGDEPQGNAVPLTDLSPTVTPPAAAPALQTAAGAAGARRELSSGPARAALPRGAEKGPARTVAFAPAGLAPAASAPLPTGEKPEAAAASAASATGPVTAAATAAAALMPAVGAATDALPPAPASALASEGSAPPLPPSTAFSAPSGARGDAAIDQVVALREALRSAQPAMTLRHAEFGTIALSIEPAAGDQWRAVLASRDPGFVPAIQAALAERALAPAASSDAGFAGQPHQHGASQNGAGDQRYGASPNSGQGGSQPYLGQSGSRDGEAAPDHRRPSTAAALAALGQGEAEDSAAAARTAGGLFA